MNGISSHLEFVLTFSGHRLLLDEKPPTSSHDGNRRFILIIRLFTRKTNNRLYSIPCIYNPRHVLVPTSKACYVAVEYEVKAFMMPTKTWQEEFGTDVNKDCPGCITVYLTPITVIRSYLLSLLRFVTLERKLWKWHGSEWIFTPCDGEFF